jgi:hypothetical protein
MPSLPLGIQDSYNNSRIKDLADKNKCSTYNDNYNKCFDAVYTQKHLPMSYCDQYMRAYQRCQDLRSQIYGPTGVASKTGISAFSSKKQ